MALFCSMLLGPLRRQKQDLEEARRIEISDQNKKEIVNRRSLLKISMVALGHSELSLGVFKAEAAKLFGRKVVERNQTQSRMGKLKVLSLQQRSTYLTLANKDSSEHTHTHTQNTQSTKHTQTRLPGGTLKPTIPTQLSMRTLSGGEKGVCVCLYVYVCVYVGQQESSNAREQRDSIMENQQLFREDNPRSLGFTLKL